MRTFVLVVSPVSAIMVMYGWIGILSNTNVVRDALPMHIALTIFAIGLIGIYRGGCYFQSHWNCGDGLFGIAFGLIYFMLIIIAPVYLLITLVTSYAHYAFWVAIVAYGATWFAMLAPEFTQS